MWGYYTMKVYTILKNIYRDEQEPVVTNFFFSNVASIEILEKWFDRIINAEDVKKVWITQNDKDQNMFYIIYTEDFEKDFYHGFVIQVLDTDTNMQYNVTKEYEKDYKEIRDILEKYIISKGE